VTHYTFDDFDTITASGACLLIFNDSLKCTRNYCVDGSIDHFKFPKVVLARISGEVGTLCTVLFRDMSTNFYWNLSIFDRHRAKSRHVFIETQCVFYDASCGMNVVILIQMRARPDVS